MIVMLEWLHLVTAAAAALTCHMLARLEQFQQVTGSLEWLYGRFSLYLFLERNDLRGMRQLETKLMLMLVLTQTLMRRR